MKTSRILILCVVLTVTLFAGQQLQPPPQDVSRLLEKVAAAYSAIADYRITVTRKSNTTSLLSSPGLAERAPNGGGIPLPFNSSETLSRGIHEPVLVSRENDFPLDHDRILLARSGQSVHYEKQAVPAHNTPVVWITNGQTVWHYFPAFNRYSERPSPAWPKVAGPGGGLPGFEWEYVTRFRSIGDMANRARFIKTDIHPDHACHGLSTEIELETGTLDQSPPERLRILEDSHLVCESTIRSSRVHGSFPEHRVITTIWQYNQLSGPVDPALFAFTPPKGSTRAATFQ